jgi:chemotaxis protein methyltransferase CheR
MSTVPVADEYVLFCEGVRRLCQIDLLQYKRGQMERRIRSFAERRGAARLAEYLSLLRERQDELEDFLDRVTINVSQLWRNPEQWNVLAEEVLPELAAEGRIRAWSAGCSYGAEVYTLAAVCSHHAPGVRLEIHGTDIDPRMVARAREGHFTADDARAAPSWALERFFVRDGDGWIARAALRSVCTFETGDLLRMPFPRHAYDLVLCRNTVIYFNDGVRDDLHRRLAATLRPEGCLLVGSTERVAQPHEIGLVPVRPFVYRKREL